jgi:hypothetical protein
MFTPFQHPIATYAAGTVLGYRRDGRPILPIAGGSGEGEGTPPAEGQPPATPPAPTPPAPPAPSGEDSAATIARLEKQLEAARAEAAKSRTNAKQTAADEARSSLVQELGKALGLIKDGEAADPAKLTKQLTEAQAEHRTARLELAVHKAAGAAGADPAALLDSRAFLASLGDVDPGDLTAVTKAVTDAVKANPKLGSAPQAGAPRSGAELPGGPGKAPTSRSTSLSAAIRGHYQAGS